MQASRVVRIVSLAVALLLPGTIAAAADEPLPPVTPFIDSEPAPPSKWVASGADNPVPQPRRWYGGQIIAADLATLGCIALTQHELCLFPYLFAGAAIHGFHGRPDHAGLSIALRVLAPGIGAMAGVLIGGCVPGQQEPMPPRQKPSNTDAGDSPSLDFELNIHVPPCAGEMVVGALVGVAAGLVLDAALAFTPSTVRVADPPARAAVQLAPRLSFGQEHLTLGLSATF